MSASPDSNTRGKTLSVRGVKKEYAPDTGVRLTVWCPAAMTRTLWRVCRKWEMPQSDVVRYTLEAMVPQFAARGIDAFLSEHDLDELHSPAAKKRPEQFPMKITARTSGATLDLIAALRTRKRGRPVYSQAEILRYSYQAGFALALTKGVSHILRLREEAILTRGKTTRVALETPPARSAAARGKRNPRPSAAAAQPTPRSRG